MSADENIEIFRRVIVFGFNQGNFTLINDLISTAYEEHQSNLLSTFVGFKRTISNLRAAFPDIQLTIEEMISHEDKVWARCIARGTHRGVFMGVPPTGKSFEIQVIDICRFEDGKIVEHWGAPDHFDLLRQLDILQVAMPANAQLRGRLQSS